MQREVTKENFFNKVDLKLLKAQKKSILQMIVDSDQYNIAAEQVSALDGILNLLDSIQDIIEDEK